VDLTLGLKRPSRPGRRFELSPAAVGAALAAGGAGETILNVGQAKVIGPLIGIDGDAVAAAVVAIDQQPAHPISRNSANVIFCGRSMPEHLHRIIGSRHDLELGNGPWRASLPLPCRRATSLPLSKQKNEGPTEAVNRIYRTA